MPRHFLSQNDVSRDEFVQILDSAVALRASPISDRLHGRSMVMFFEKTSTRTRLSFEIGMTHLGGHAVHLDRDSSQLSRGESIRDTALVVSRYADIMMGRVNRHATLTELAKFASIPVINGLSDLEHPMQSMGDLLTVRDHKGKLQGLKLAFVGDGDNNVTHSLLLACSRVGMDIAVAAPAELQPDPSFIDMARENASVSGSAITITTDPAEAAAGADVLYTDVWVSMGRETEREERLRLLDPFRIDNLLVGRAKANCIVMHCLPQHIGDEISESVAYGPQSVIFDQAENRLHVQKAMILFLVEGNESDG